MTTVQKAENKQRSGIRSTLERVFGLPKLHRCKGKTRYVGLERNKARVQLRVMRYNIKFGLSIDRKLKAWQEGYAKHLY